MKKIFIFLVVMFFVFGCQRDRHRAVEAPAEKEANNEKEVIDITTMLKEYSLNDIPEFRGRAWSIAVRNIKTGYIYYYDASNKFLGREKK